MATFSPVSFDSDAFDVSDVDYVFSRSARTVIVRPEMRSALISGEQRMVTVAREERSRRVGDES